MIRMYAQPAKSNIDLFLRIGFPTPARYVAGRGSGAPMVTLSIAFVTFTVTLGFTGNPHLNCTLLTTKKSLRNGIRFGMTLGTDL